MAAALAGENKEGVGGRGGSGTIQRRVARSIADGIRTSVRAPRARIEQREGDNRGPAARVLEIAALKGALEKQVRELCGAPVSMYGDLEESRAGEKRAVLEKGEAVAAKDEEIGRLRDDNSGMRCELATTKAVPELETAGAANRGRRGWTGDAVPRRRQPP